MKTTHSIKQQAVRAFTLLVGSSSDGRHSTPLAKGARIGPAPRERRAELVRGVLQAFAAHAAPQQPVMGLAALLR